MLDVCVFPWGFRCLRCMGVGRVVVIFEEEIVSVGLYQ